jgi:NAD(P)H-flavin reductase
MSQPAPAPASPAPAAPAAAAAPAAPVSLLEPAKLVAVERATPHALFIRIEARPPALFETYKRPGMSVRLKLPGAGASAVPLASRPGERCFEALVEADSPLGQALAKLAPGAGVEVSAASGAGFPLSSFRRHDLYLCGFGAASGPVRAALLHALADRSAFDKLRVILEGRFLDDIPFREEIPGWQRADARIYQVLARPDMGKWKRGEGAYLHDELANLEPDPAKSVIFAAGPADMLRGVQGVARRLRVPPEKVYLVEHMTGEHERALEVERPKALLDKITPEGVHGSGHQQDAADHSPSFRTPLEQPKPIGLAPYKRGAKAGGHH